MQPLKIISLTASIAAVAYIVKSALSKPMKKNYTIEDARKALAAIRRNYGREMAIVVEKMYRWETNHFRSGQFIHTGSAGMEAHGAEPYYGWNSEYWRENPNHKPIGVWSAYENAGMSAQGGNAQVTDRKKKFLVMPSVYAGMAYLAEYIQRHGGNYARWYSTSASHQQIYRDSLAGVVPRIVNDIA